MKSLLQFIICLLFLSVNCFGQNLEYFINSGLQNSPLLKDYQNQIKTSVFDSLMVVAGQHPQINSNTQVLYAPFGNNYGYDNNITNGGMYSSLAGVSQYVFNKRMLTNKYESLNIEKTSVRNAAKISTNDLKRIITSQYLYTFSDYTERLFNKKVSQLIEEELQLMKQLVDQGIYKQSDYLSLLIEKQAQEIVSQQLQTQYRKDFQILNQICGNADSVPEKLELPAIQSTLQFDLASSPLLIQYKIDSLRIDNDKKAVDIRYVPKLNWFADAGFMASDPASIYRHFGVSAGFNLNFPIYDGHQKKIDYQKLDVSENTRQSYLNFNKNQLSVQVKQLNAELDDSKKVEENLKQQLKTINELVTLSKLQLNAGNTTIVEFVAVLRNYIDINRSYNQAIVQTLQITNELNYYLQQ